ncbi:MAG: PAS domain-containing protein [Limisphaerales bacterium]
MSTSGPYEQLWQRTRDLAASNAALRAKIIQTADLLQPLLLEEDFIKALLESSPDGVVVCDANGNLRYFNAATRRFHGLPERLLPAEGWADYYSLYLEDGITPMTKEQIPLFRALHSGSISNVKMVIAPKSGPPRKFSASGRAFFGRDGTKLGAVVVMHEIP